MVKSNQNQPERAFPAHLAEVVRKVARAVRCRENSRSTEHQMDREAEDRGRLGEKLMEWGNLVFAGLVIAQAFSDEFGFVLASVGVVVLAGAYFFAYRLTRGGEHWMREPESRAPGGRRSVSDHDSKPQPRFDLGQVVGTPGALQALQEAGQHPVGLLARHVTGDWGDLCDGDRAENVLSVE